MGQVLLRARPRATPFRATGDRALPRRVGAAGRELRSPRSRPTTTPARSPRAGSSTGSTRGSGCPRREPSRARCSSSLARRRPRTCARTSTPERNHRTLELYALLIAALALPELDARPAALARRTSCDRNLLDRLPRRRRAPRALDALPHDRAALVRRRARELPPLRRRAARRLRRAARRARATSPAHCRRPDGTIPALSDATPATTRELLDARRRGCSSAPELDASSRTAATDVQRRRLLRPARRRALPDLRLRPARRRRPRPLRPAQLRGVRGRPAARARPRPLHLRRGAAEPAPLVPRHRRPQHGDASTGSTRRPTRARAPRGPAARGALPRPQHAPRPRRARRRGPQPGLRGGPPARGSRSSTTRYWIDRGPRCSGERAATATTCASTSPPAPREIAGSDRARAGLVLPIARRRAAVARARAGSRPRYGEQPTRRSSAPSRAARARASSRCSPGDPRAARCRGDVGSRSAAHRRPRRRRAVTRPARPRPRASRSATRCSTERDGRVARSGCSAARRRCERVYAKYRVGESLRVVYRSTTAATSPAARSRRRSASVYARAPTAVGDGPPPRRARRAALERSSGRSRTTAGSRRCRCSPTGSPRSSALLGRPVHARGSWPTRAERVRDRRVPRRRRARARLREGPRDDGRARAGARARPPRAAVGTAIPRLRVPRVLAASLDDGALALEPLAGDRARRAVARRSGPRAARARRRAGDAARRPPAARAALRPARRRAARARRRGRRPRAAGLARRRAAALLERLADAPPDARARAPARRRQPAQRAPRRRPRRARRPRGRRRRPAPPPTSASVLAGLLARARGGSARASAARRGYARLRARAAGPRRAALAHRRLAARARSRCRPSAASGPALLAPPATRCCDARRERSLTG